MTPSADAVAREVIAGCDHTRGDDSACLGCITTALVGMAEGARAQAVEDWADERERLRTALRRAHSRIDALGWDSDRPLLDAIAAALRALAPADPPERRRGGGA